MRQMDERVRYWLELSDYDLDTAEAMLRTGRYLYVGFMCRQTIEKALKAYSQLVHANLPPRTHNLRVLASETLLIDELSKEQRTLLLELEPLNLEARYPENKERLHELLRKEKSSSLLEATRELQRWIKQKL